VRVRWSPRAKRELERIDEYIVVDNPKAAIRWIERLRARMRQAAKMPRAGRKVPEIDHDRFREIIVGNYRVVYWIGEGVVEVVTVFEGHLPFTGGA